MEMKIRESCLQTGTFIYKLGILVTKQDFHLQSGSLGLQMGFSGYYLPSHYIFQLYSRIKLLKSLEKTIVYDRIEIKMLYYAFLRIVVQNAFDT